MELQVYSHKNCLVRPEFM